jgi:hypothetical protein
MTGDDEAWPSPREPVKLLPPLFDEPAPQPHDDGDRGAVAPPMVAATHAGNRATRRPGMLASQRSTGLRAQRAA